MTQRTITFCLLSLLVGVAAACDPMAGETPQPTAPPQTQPYDPATSGTQWDRNSAAVVFRADVTGGSNEPFLTQSEVPSCTIYGDGRIVWRNDLAPFNEQILYDQLSDTALLTFVDYLILTERIYNYDARARLQVPNSNSPSVEMLQLNVNNQPHTTDAFAGWDYEYYTRIVSSCQTLSVAPVIFEPAAAWVSMREVPYDPAYPLIVWDAAASGLSLTELAQSAEPRWIETSIVPVLWNLKRTSEPFLVLEQDERTFWFAVEVPNVTRDSPPAPAPAP